MLSCRGIPRLSTAYARYGRTFTPSFSSSALTLSRRQYVGQVFLSNFSTHAASLSACTSLSTMLYSPLGTAMLVLLAYNVVVVGGKHSYYLIDLTAKDYVQDPQLYVVIRYGVLICVLLGMEVLFVEV
ncbi:unnamed protein product [Phytomonas sp. Hart1]|nr:unnamed protein product [Phytomonas sp. Hart1]|eukprot:CCW66211.1 unnamed protein product [Phytomonas sp. isolate Hart1]